MGNFDFRDFRVFFAMGNVCSLQVFVIWRLPGRGQLADPLFQQPKSFGNSQQDIYIYMSKAFGVHSCTLDPPVGGMVLFGAFGHELMHPEAYLDRPASTNHVSHLKNIIRGLFPSTLLSSLSVSAYQLCVNVCKCVLLCFYICFFP